MLSIPLLLLGLFGLFSYTRGALHLVRVGNPSLNREQLNPHQEAHIITRILLSSMLLAVTLTFALVMPLLLEDLIGLFAHRHLPQGDVLHRMMSFFSTPHVVFSGLFVLGVFLVWAWGPLLAQWRKLQRWIRALKMLASQSGLPHPDVLAEISDTFNGPIILVPGAWAGLAGVYRPRLFLGVELLSALTQDELRALLAHEEAHRQRQDPFYQVLLLFCSRLLPYVGPRLFSRWSERIEEICDQFAANQMNDPLIVATALLHTRRLQLELVPTLSSPTETTGCPTVTGFTQHSCTEIRISRLLELDRALAPPLAPSYRPFLTSKLLFLLLLLQVPLHHLLEHLVFLLR